MKKGIIYTLLGIIVIGSLCGFLFLTFKVESIKHSNKKMEKEIVDKEEEINDLSIMNVEYEKEVTNLTSENKGIIEEKEIWQKTEEKLKKALSD